MESLIISPLRSYITSRLLSALKQYVSNISVEALGVLSSDLVLNNLELRLDTLKSVLPLPPGIELSRGFVRELRLHIPWTSLLSSAIDVKLDGLEVVISHVPPTATATNENEDKSRSRRGTAVSVQPAQPATGGSDQSALPSWLQSRITRILANISLSVTNMVLMYSHGGHALSLTARSIAVVSSDPAKGWSPAYVEPNGPKAQVCKTLAVRDLSVTFDEDGANGDRHGRPARADSSHVVGSGGGAATPGSRSAATSVAGPDAGTLEAVAAPAARTPTRLPARATARARYSEEPLLHKCNMLIRARVPLNPDGADDADEEEQEQEQQGYSGSRRGPAVPAAAFSNGSYVSPLQAEADALESRRAAAGHGHGQASGQPGPGITGPTDPFACQLLSWLPGTLEFLGDPAVGALRPTADSGKGAGRPSASNQGQQQQLAPTASAAVPIDAAVSLLHLYVDCLDMSLSARQAQALARIGTELGRTIAAGQLGDDGTDDLGVDGLTAPASASAHTTVDGQSGATLQPRAQKSGTAEPGSDDDGQGKGEGGDGSPADEAGAGEEAGPGVIGWLWSTVVGGNGPAAGEGTGDEASAGNTSRDGDDDGAAAGASSAPARCQSTAPPRVLVVNVHVGTASVTLLAHRQEYQGQCEQYEDYEGADGSREVGVEREADGHGSATAAGSGTTAAIGSFPSGALAAHGTAQPIGLAPRHVAQGGPGPPRGHGASPTRAPHGGLAAPSGTQSHAEDTADVDAHSSQRMLWTPVPFMRLSVQPSWLHARVVQAGPTDPRADSRQSNVADASTASIRTGSRPGRGIAAITGELPQLQVSDIYCDLGSVAVESWSAAQEAASVDARAYGRARAIALLYAATLSHGHGPAGSHHGAGGAGGGAGRPYAHSTASAGSLTTTGVETGARSRGPSTADLMSPARQRARGSSAVSGAADVAGTAGILASPDRRRTRGDTAGNAGGHGPHADAGLSPSTPPPRPPRGSPGQGRGAGSAGRPHAHVGHGHSAAQGQQERQSYASWGKARALVTVLAEAPQPVGLSTAPSRPLALARHPYFHCSLLPEIDSDMVAGPHEQATRDVTDNLACRVHVTVVAGAGHAQGQQVSVHVLAAPLDLTVTSHLLEGVTAFLPQATQDGPLESGKESADGHENQQGVNGQLTRPALHLQATCGGVTVVAGPHGIHEQTPDTPAPLLQVGYLSVALLSCQLAGPAARLIEGLSTLPVPALIPSLIRHGSSHPRDSRGRDEDDNEDYDETPRATDKDESGRGSAGGKDRQAVFAAYGGLLPLYARLAAEQSRAGPYRPSGTVIVGSASSTGRLLLGVAATAQQVTASTDGLGHVLPHEQLAVQLEDAQLALHSGRVTFQAQLRTADAADAGVDAGLSASSGSGQLVDVSVYVTVAHCAVTSQNSSLMKVGEATDGVQTIDATPALEARLHASALPLTCLPAELRQAVLEPVPGTLGASVARTVHGAATAAALHTGSSAHSPRLDIALQCGKGSLDLPLLQWLLRSCTPPSAHSQPAVIGIGTEPKMKRSGHGDAAQQAALFQWLLQACNKGSSGRPSGLTAAVEVHPWHVVLHSSHHGDGPALVLQTPVITMETAADGSIDVEVVGGSVLLVPGHAVSEPGTWLSSSSCGLMVELGGAVGLDVPSQMRAPQASTVSAHNIGSSIDNGTPVLTVAIQVPRLQGCVSVPLLQCLQHMAGQAQAGAEVGTLDAANGQVDSAPVSAPPTPLALALNLSVSAKEASVGMVVPARPSPAPEHGTDHGKGSVELLLLYVQGIALDLSLNSTASNTHAAVGGMMQHVPEVDVSSSLVLASAALNSQVLAVSSGGGWLSACHPQHRGDQPLPVDGRVTLLAAHGTGPAGDTAVGQVPSFLDVQYQAAPGHRPVARASAGQLTALVPSDIVLALLSSLQALQHGTAMGQSPEHPTFESARHGHPRLTALRQGKGNVQPAPAQVELLQALQTSVPLFPLASMCLLPVLDVQVGPWRVGLVASGVEGQASLAAAWSSAALQASHSPEGPDLHTVHISSSVHGLALVASATDGQDHVLAQLPEISTRVTSKAAFHEQEAQPRLDLDATVGVQAGEVGLHLDARTVGIAASVARALETVGAAATAVQPRAAGPAGQATATNAGAGSMALPVPLALACTAQYSASLAGIRVDYASSSSHYRAAVTSAPEGSTGYDEGSASWICTVGRAAIEGHRQLGFLIPAADAGNAVGPGFFPPLTGRSLWRRVQGHGTAHLTRVTVHHGQALLLDLHESRTGHHSAGGALPWLQVQWEESGLPADGTGRATPEPGPAAQPLRGAAVASTAGPALWPLLAMTVQMGRAQVHMTTSSLRGMQDLGRELALAAPPNNNTTGTAVDIVTPLGPIPPPSIGSHDMTRAQPSPTGTAPTASPRGSPIPPTPSAPTLRHLMRFKVLWEGVQVRLGDDDCGNIPSLILARNDLTGGIRSHPTSAPVLLLHVDHVFATAGGAIADVQPATASVTGQLKAWTAASPTSFSSPGSGTYVSSSSPDLFSLHDTLLLGGSLQLVGVGVSLEGGTGTGSGPTDIIRPVPVTATFLTRQYASHTGEASDPRNSPTAGTTTLEVSLPAVRAELRPKVISGLMQLAQQLRPLANEDVSNEGLDRMSSAAGSTAVVLAEPSRTPLLWQAEPEAVVHRLASMAVVQGQEHSADSSHHAEPLCPTVSALRSETLLAVDLLALTQAGGLGTAGGTGATAQQQGTGRQAEVLGARAERPGRLTISDVVRYQARDGIATSVTSAGPNPQDHTDTGRDGGGYYGCMSWSYAQPVRIQRVSAASHAAVARHSFLALRRHKPGTAGQGGMDVEQLLPVPSDTVPPRLDCVLERLCISSGDSPSWTPTAIFAVPLVSSSSGHGLSSRASQHRGLDSMGSGPGGPAELLDYCLDFRLLEAGAVGMDATGTSSSTADVQHVPGRAAVASWTAATLASTQWRVRWREAVLTDSAQSAGPSTAPEEVRHGPYASVCVALAAVLRMHALPVSPVPLPLLHAPSLLLRVTCEEASVGLFSSVQGRHPLLSLSCVGMAVSGHAFTSALPGRSSSGQLGLSQLHLGLASVALAGRSPRDGCTMDVVEVSGPRLLVLARPSPGSATGRIGCQDEHTAITLPRVVVRVAMPVLLQLMQGLSGLLHSVSNSNDMYNGSTGRLVVDNCTDVPVYAVHVLPGHGRGSSVDDGAQATAEPADGSRTAVIDATPTVLKVAANSTGQCTWSPCPHSVAGSASNGGTGSPVTRGLAFSALEPGATPVASPSGLAANSPVPSLTAAVLVDEWGSLDAAWQTKLTEGVLRWLPCTRLPVGMVEMRGAGKPQTGVQMPPEPIAVLSPVLVSSRGQQGHVTVTPTVTLELDPAVMDTLQGLAYGRDSSALAVHWSQEVTQMHLQAEEHGEAGDTTDAVSSDGERSGPNPVPGNGASTTATMSQAGAATTAVGGLGLLGSLWSWLGGGEEEAAGQADDLEAGQQLESTVPAARPMVAVTRQSRLEGSVNLSRDRPTAGIAAVATSGSQDGDGVASAVAVAVGPKQSKSSPKAGPVSLHLSIRTGDGTELVSSPLTVEVDAAPALMDHEPRTVLMQLTGPKGQVVTVAAEVGQASGELGHDLRFVTVKLRPMVSMACRLSEFVALLPAGRAVRDGSHEAAGHAARLDSWDGLYPRVPRVGSEPGQVELASTRYGSASPSVAGLAALDAMVAALGPAMQSASPAVTSVQAGTARAPGLRAQALMAPVWQADGAEGGPQSLRWLPHSVLPTWCLVHAGWRLGGHGPISSPRAPGLAATDQAALVCIQPPTDDAGAHVAIHPLLSITNQLPLPTLLCMATVADPELEAVPLWPEEHQGAGPKPGRITAGHVYLQPGGRQESCIVPVLSAGPDGRPCLRLKVFGPPPPYGSAISASGSAESAVELLLPIPSGMGHAAGLHVPCSLPWPGEPSYRLPAVVTIHVGSGGASGSAAGVAASTVPGGFALSQPPTIHVCIRPRAVVQLKPLPGPLSLTARPVDNTTARALGQPAHAVDEHAHCVRAEVDGWTVVPVLAARVSLSLIQQPPVCVQLSTAQERACASHGVETQASISEGPASCLSFRLGEGGPHACPGPVDRYRSSLHHEQVQADIDTTAGLLSLPSLQPGHAVRFLWPPRQGVAALGQGKELQTLLRAECVYDSVTGVTCLRVEPEPLPPVILDGRGLPRGEQVTVSLPRPVRVSPGTSSAWTHAYCSPWERIAVMSGLVRKIEASLRAARALQAPREAASDGPPKAPGRPGTSRAVELAGTPLASPVRHAVIGGFDLAAAEVTVAQAKVSLQLDVDAADDCLRRVADDDEDEEDGDEEQADGGVDDVRAAMPSSASTDQGAARPRQLMSAPQAPTVHPLLTLQRRARRGAGPVRPHVTIQPGHALPFDWLLLADIGLPFIRPGLYSQPVVEHVPGSPTAIAGVAGLGGANVAKRLFDGSGAEGGAGVEHQMRGPSIMPIPWVPAYPACWAQQASQPTSAMASARKAGAVSDVGPGGAAVSPARGAAAPSPSSSGTGTAGAAAPAAPLPSSSTTVSAIPPVPPIMKPQDLDMLHSDGETSAVRARRLVHGAAYWRQATATAGLRPARVAPDDQPLAQQYPTVRVWAPSASSNGRGYTDLQLTRHDDRQQGTSGPTIGQGQRVPGMRCRFLGGSVVVPLHAAVSHAPAVSRTSRLELRVGHVNISLMHPQPTMGHGSSVGLRYTEQLALHALRGSGGMDASWLAKAHGRAEMLASQQVHAVLGTLQLDDHMAGARFPVIASVGKAADAVAVEGEGGQSMLQLSGGRSNADATADQDAALSVSASLHDIPAAQAPHSTPSTMALGRVSASVGPIRLQLSDVTAARYLKSWQAWPGPLVAVGTDLTDLVEQLLQSAGLAQGAAATIDSRVLTGSPPQPRPFTCSGLAIAPVSAEVSLHAGAASGPQGPLSAGTNMVLQVDRAAPLFVSVDRMSVGLSGVQLDRPLCSQSRLARELLASALTDLLLSSPAVLGSLDLLGNPTRLVRSVALGFADLISEPLRAVTGQYGQQGTSEAWRPLVLGVLTGVARGARNFAAHLGEGALTSVSGLSLSLARNLERATGLPGTSLGQPGPHSGPQAGTAWDVGGPTLHGPYEDMAVPAAWTSDEHNGFLGTGFGGCLSPCTATGPAAGLLGRSTPPPTSSGGWSAPSVAGLLVRPLAGALDLLGRGSAGAAAALVATSPLQHVRPAGHVDVRLHLQ